jgi:hypothetical protein
MSSLARAAALLALVTALSPGAASAQEALPVATIHPIFAAVPDAPRADEAHKAFAAAVGRYRLGPVEVMDAPGRPAPRAPELLRAGKSAVEAKRFDEAAAALDAAVAEVNATGAAGLDTAALADLFLHQAMAAQQADWKDPPAPLTDIAPPKAKEAYLRAAVLAPDRVLFPRQFPPIVQESWRLATAEVKRRPRGTLVVRAPSSALIAVDGGPLKPGLLPAADLRYGEHWIRVEDPGRQPWASLVPLTEMSLEIDAPQTAPLTVDDREAAAHARHQGAVFGLVAELGPGRPATLELRLIEARSGTRVDATSLPFPGDPGALDAAVMRLDEQARRTRFAEQRGGPPEPRSLQDIVVAPVPPPTVSDKPRFADDPGAWARARWPLLTAIGVAAGTAIVLGAIVASDHEK